MPIGSTTPPCAAATLPHVVLCTVAELASGKLLGPGDEPVTVSTATGPAALALTMNRGGRLLVDLETEVAPSSSSSEKVVQGPTETEASVAATVGGESATASTKTRAPGPVKRSVALAMHPTTTMTAGTSSGTLHEVFAFDRNCYHVGYPLDLGPIEDVPFAGRGMTRGKKSTTESGTVAKADDGDDGQVAVRRPAPPPSSLRPGRLDCDLPVASSEGRQASESASAPVAACATTNSGATTAYTCVTCPLHNRIFDLRTGDMIALAAAADDAEVTVATPTTCKQRIHQVIFLRRASSASAAEGTEQPQQQPALAVFPNLKAAEAAGFAVLPDPWAAGGASSVRSDDLVGFIDSFGASNPMRLPHLAGVRHLRNTLIPSDAENKPRAPQVPLL